MLRLLARITITLIANAVGLLIAAAVLPGFSITPVPFVTALLIFTLVEMLAAPALSQASERSLPALSGGVALVSTFIGLLIASWVSEGITISGISTWLGATLIVWLCAMVATILLPMVMFKRWLSDRRDG